MREKIKKVWKIIALICIILIVVVVLTISSRKEKIDDNILDTNVQETSTSTSEGDFANEVLFTGTILKYLKSVDLNRTERETLCKKISFTKPLEQEIAYQNEIVNNASIKYLRSKLDAFFKSKFIVLQTDPAPGGGTSIVLMIKERPYDVYYAWVYDYGNGEYDLRGFSKYELDGDAPSIEETQEMFINQICDEDFGF